MKFMIVYLVFFMVLFCGPAQSQSLPADKNLAYFEDDVRATSEQIKEEIRKFHMGAMFDRIMDLVSRRDAIDAQKTLDAVVKDSPELKQNAVVDLFQGEIYFWKGDYKNAYASADKIVRRIEDDYGPRGPQKKDNNDSENAFLSDTYFNRGTAGMRLYKIKESVADFDKAFELMPRAFIPLNKCRALLAMERYQEAARAFEQAFEMNAETADSSDKDLICKHIGGHGFKIAACESYKPTTGN